MSSNPQPAQAQATPHSYSLGSYYCTVCGAQGRGTSCPGYPAKPAAAASTASTANSIYPLWKSQAAQPTPTWSPAGIEALARYKAYSYERLPNGDEVIRKGINSVTSSILWDALVANAPFAVSYTGTFAFPQEALDRCEELRRFEHTWPSTYPSGCAYLMCACGFSAPVTDLHHPDYMNCPLGRAPIQLELEPAALSSPSRPRCFQCNVELCTYLDAYYGIDEFAKDMCAKCRKGR